MDFLQCNMLTCLSKTSWPWALFFVSLQSGFFRCLLKISLDIFSNFPPRWYKDVMTVRINECILLPFCFPATIFITLHSSSEQVLAALLFPTRAAPIMTMDWWLDLFIASWHRSFFLPPPLIFGADSFHANSSKATLCSAKFALACWSLKGDGCPDRCELLQCAAWSHTGSRFLGGPFWSRMRAQAQRKCFH